MFICLGCLLPDGLTDNTRALSLAVINTKNTRTMSVNLSNGDGFGNSRVFFLFYNDDYVLKDITNMPILTLNDNIIS